MTNEIWAATDLGEGHGVKGCQHSHLSMYQEMLDQKEERWTVLEDDCEFVKDIPFIPLEYDIFLLGTNENVVWRPIFQDTAWEGQFVQIGRFWGTHAMIMTDRAAQAILDSYRECNAAGNGGIAMDWLVNYAIRAKKLKVFGFSDGLSVVRQKEGLKSAITGKIRQ